MTKNEIIKKLHGSQQLEINELVLLMQNLIGDLVKMGVSYQAVVGNRAGTSAEYDRSIAKTMIELKNGKAFEIGDTIVVNPIASNIERLAKGICWKQKLDRDTAEGLYKTYFAKLDALKVAINGCQSIKKNLIGFEGDGG